MLKNVLGFICLSLSIGANAVPVTVEGQDYNILVVDISFDQASPLLEAQVWWGDHDLASLFALEAGSEVQAFFAWDVSEDFSSIGEFAVRSRFWTDFGGGVFGAIGPSDSATTYAFAQLIPSPIPLPAAAWLFGSALLGLGAAKRRKA